MDAASLRDRIAPWAGWLTASLAVVLNQQGLGSMIYFDCRLGNPGSAVIISLVTLAIAAAGGVISWRARWPEGGPPELNARAFIALIGVMMAGLYAFTLVLLLLAGLIIPSCVR